VYTRPTAATGKLLLTTLDRDNATVIELTLDPKAMERWLPIRLARPITCKARVRATTSAGIPRGRFRTKNSCTFLQHMVYLNDQPSTQTRRKARPSPATGSSPPPAIFSGKRATPRPAWPRSWSARKANSGSFYHFFDSKEALLLAVLDAYLEASMPR